MVLLRVEAQLGETAETAVHGETRRGHRDEGAAVQDAAALPVAQHGVEPVVRRGALPLRCQVERNRFGHPEDLQHLVDEMRPKVVPQSAARAGLFPPTGAHLRPVAVEVRFEMNDVPQFSRGDDLLQSQEVRVPAPVVEYREEAAGGRSLRLQAASLGQGYRERLVDHDMLACGECHAGQREVAVVGCRDDDEVDLGAGKEIRRRRVYRDIRPVGFDFGRVAARNRCELKTGNTDNQWRVEGLAGKAVTDDGNVQGFGHGLLPFRYRRSFLSRERG